MASMKKSCSWRWRSRGWRPRSEAPPYSAAPGRTERYRLASGAPTARDLGEHALRAARSDQQGQLQQARGRVAVQDRQPRTAAGVQLPVHAADGRRHGLHDGRHAPRRRGARRRHRRDDVDAQRGRRQARRGGAASALGPRPRVLVGRPIGANHLRHARLPDDGARREDRRARSPRSARTASSI